MYYGLPSTKLQVVKMMMYVHSKCTNLLIVFRHQSYSGCATSKNKILRLNTRNLIKNEFRFRMIKNKQLYA